MTMNMKNIGMHDMSLTTSEQQDLSDFEEIEKNLAGGNSIVLYSSIDRNDIDGMWLLYCIQRLYNKKNMDLVEQHVNRK